MRTDEKTHEDQRAKEVWEIGQWDWWTLPDGQRLHAAEVAYDALQDTSGNGITACGRQGFLSIPGIFSRMGVERCARCCAVLGYPRGSGSPKNDPACRPLVEQRIRDKHE